jgi:hypothetical protein
VAHRAFITARPFYFELAYCIYTLIMSIVLAPRIIEKLRTKHNVSEAEVREAVSNICGQLLIDTREEHATDPPTLWFVAETNAGRLLKVIFIHKEGNNVVKSAYDASEKIQAIYNKFGK